jgi:hypothetical protein
MLVKRRVRFVLRRRRATLPLPKTPEGAIIGEMSAKYVVEWRAR